MAVTHPRQDDPQWGRMRELVQAVPDRPRIWVEYPRGSMVKRRSDGRVDFVSPLPCPYNYGSVPDHPSDDGDALDALVLGGARLPIGWVIKPVVGWVAFVDRGCMDPKLICSDTVLTTRQVLGLHAFFHTYALFKKGLHRARGPAPSTRYLGLSLGFP